MEILTLDQKTDGAESAEDCISELKDRVEEISQKATGKKKTLKK